MFRHDAKHTALYVTCYQYLIMVVDGSDWTNNVSVSLINHMKILTGLQYNDSAVRVLNRSPQKKIET